MHLEIVCCTPDDCRAAQDAGATRIELCSAIEVGGVTPSLGCLRVCTDATSLPIMVMIRPRSGDFTYSESEIQAMLHDIAAAMENGASGVIFGALGAGRIDVNTCRRLVQASAGLQKVFHRAFDQVESQLESLECLIDLGFQRILTSGGRATASEGLDQLRALAEVAEGRIEVLPGGKVRAANAEEILQKSGCNQLHLAPFENVEGKLALNLDEIAQVRKVLERVADTSTK